MDIMEIRDGGDRSVLGTPLVTGKPLERVANLAIALKQALTDDRPVETRAAADRLLFDLGRTLVRTEAP
jgi:hypothetical protein